jgi:hypothetical protein
MGDDWGLDSVEQALPETVVLWGDPQAVLLTPKFRGTVNEDVDSVSGGFNGSAYASTRSEYACHALALQS